MLFAGLLLATIKRPVFAVSLYMLTFFLSPPFWWWGDAIESIRWNLISGFILLGAGFLCPAPVRQRRIDMTLKISLAIILNATLVNFVIAGNSSNSSDAYVEMLKYFLLMYLMFRTVRSTQDLQIVIMSILLGAAYIGYEATINERGEIVNNRLEGVGAPGATTANHFASLMVTVLPLVAPVFLAGRTAMKVASVCLAPMIVNTILLCNSRGAFLAAIASGIVFIFSVPKSIRSKAWKAVGIGAFGVFLLLGDTRIVDRFVTTFSSQEDRDASAQSRLDFAKAGLLMIQDYPIGAGGNGFKKVHGVRYLRKTGASDVARAVHNGYLNEACEWGLQGLLLRLIWIFLAFCIAYRYIRRFFDDPSADEFLLLTQSALLAGFVAYLITYLFGDQNSSEWGYWIVALIMSVAAIGTNIPSSAIIVEGSEKQLYATKPL